MSVAFQTCPYCNASVPEAGPPGRRLTCLRCGETFAPQKSDAIQGPGNVVSSPILVASPPPTPTIDRYLDRQTDGRRRNLRMGMIVLGVMIGMGGAGLTLALLTQPQRRANDGALPGQLKNSQSGTDPAAAPPGIVPAEQSPLMGYVPDGTNVLLGLHLAEMRENPQARELLHKEITAPGHLNLPLDINRWIDLAGDEVDYALLTGTLTRNLLIGDFSLALLVRTRQPVNEAEVIKRLQATEEKVSGLEIKTWRFSPKGQKLDWSLRFVDPHTLALGILPSHLAAVPATPRAGLGHLSAGLRQGLQRVETGGVVWLAMSLDQATRDVILGRSAKEKKDERSPLRSIQTMAAWVRPGPTYTLSAEFFCADKAAAESLRDYLASLAPTVPETDLKFALEGAKLDVQRRADMATILQAIDKGLKH